MKSFVAASAVMALAATVATAKPIVESPANLIECQPAAITWSDAADGSVYLSVVKGTDVSSTPLVSFPTQSGSSGSYTWSKVNVTAGTTVTFIVNDSVGQPNYSSQVTIQSGSDSSCVSDDASSSSSGSGSSSGSSSGSNSGSSSGSNTSSSGSSPSSSSSGSSSAATTSSSSTSSDASKSGAAGFASVNSFAAAALTAFAAGAAFLA